MEIFHIQKHITYLPLPSNLTGKICDITIIPVFTNITDALKKLGPFVEISNLLRISISDPVEKMYLVVRYDYLRAGECRQFTTYFETPSIRRDIRTEYTTQIKQIDKHSVGTLIEECVKSIPNTDDFEKFKKSFDLDSLI